MRRLGLGEIFLLPSLGQIGSKILKMDLYPSSIQRGYKTNLILMFGTQLYCAKKHITIFQYSGTQFRGGSKKSKEFFEAYFKKVGIWDLQDKFFREYYRSGNVFFYRFDADLQKADALKITQTFGADNNESVTIPVRYVVLNPADIQIAGSISFAQGTYFKVISDYELQRLRNPQTEEDLQVLNTLDEESRKAIKNKGAKSVLLPLNAEKINAIFYKKQDYEPFAVPMGYPVLEDINWKAEMKKMDMAITRTMQQAILLVTMGAEPEKGGVNQKNLMAMQNLFENQSVGRVLIADYTTEAKFIIPDIASLLDPKKYAMVDKDIQIGLNNVLLGAGEKYANQQSKMDVFIGRLKQGREAFLNEFLIPEIKRIAKILGFKNYPTPEFDKMNFGDQSLTDRIYTRLIEIGVLTPEEGITAIEAGRLPTNEESEEAQENYKKLRGKGYYEPIMGGPETQMGLVDKQHQGQMELQKDQLKSQEKLGREKMKQGPQGAPPAAKKKPAGQKGGGDNKNVPQKQRVSTPIGQRKVKTQATYSLSKVTENLSLATKLNKSVEVELRKAHKIKRLSKKQKEIAEDITGLIISNEKPENWAKEVKAYVKRPVDKNPDRIKEVEELACEHQIDPYLAAILYVSKK